MDYKFIADETLKNGGHTAAELGGRYIVALEGFEEVVSLESLADKIKAYSVKYAEEFARPGRALGTWINKGKCYSDISKAYKSKAYKSKASAIKAGRKMGKRKRAYNG